MVRSAERIAQPLDGTVGDTVGWHMLVGQRRWSVEIVGGTTVALKTESYDYPRDQVNRLGMWLLGSPRQLKVWTEYFENLRDHYVAQGATVASDVQGSQENLPSEQSPWPPANPYPGVEVP
jgi:hypothetical protein